MLALPIALINNTCASLSQLWCLERFYEDDDESWRVDEINYLFTLASLDSDLGGLQDDAQMRRAYYENIGETAHLERSIVRRHSQLRYQ